MQKNKVYIAIGLAVLLLIFLFLFLKPFAQEEQPADVSQTQSHSIPTPELENIPPQAPPVDIWSHNIWLGDYTEMVGRRIIRVLIPPGKTFFFLDEGKKRGLAYDNMMAFERYVNKHLKSKHMQVKVVVIPTSRKNLIPYLKQGFGDIVAGNLTITEERLKQVAFSDPLLQDIEEIVVSSKTIPILGNLFDLSGQDVYVRKSSSYYGSLQKLNATLLSLNKKPVHLYIVDEYLEDEDLLEMMNAGLIPMIVMDSHKAGVWEDIFPEIRLQRQLKLRVGGKIGLAVRKETPELLQVVNGFVKENKKGTLAGNMLFTKYMVDSNYIKNNLNKSTRIKYRQTLELFRKYGRQYDWPHLLLIALAYQESGLDNKKRSKVGAIGIMQVLPRTARDKHVAIDNIKNIENNIHAGAKYLRFIKSRYFSDDALDELNSNLFSIAAYNAGPARVVSLRQDAASKGLDPNVWFNNVEVVASHRIGRETVQYVGNIFKYYVVYKNFVKQQQAKSVGKELIEQDVLAQ